MWRNRGQVPIRPINQNAAQHVRVILKAGRTERRCEAASLDSRPRLSRLSGCGVSDSDVVLYRTVSAAEVAVAADTAPPAASSPTTRPPCAPHPVASMPTWLPLPRSWRPWASTSRRPPSSPIPKPGAPSPGAWSKASPAGRSCRLCRLHGQCPPEHHQALRLPGLQGRRARRDHYRPDPPGPVLLPP